MQGYRIPSSWFVERTEYLIFFPSQAEEALVVIGLV
jgi:hypothetical protein